MPPAHQSEVSLYYARVLDRLTKTGFVFLALTFFLYVSGILIPYVPLVHLPHYWSNSVSHYLAETRLQTGWSWLGRLSYGDLLNFLPISLLAAATTFCYLLILVKLFKSRERLLGVIALLQVIVLLLAASGLFVLKGH